MRSKIYRIKPLIESRVWGGQKLQEQFGYQTDLENIAEAYHVIAIPNHLDNEVEGTNLHLSEFYHENRSLFDCDSEDLPVRLVSACASGRLSYHLHPTDQYGLEHEGMRGKLEGSFTLRQSSEEYEMFLGHNAKTKEEFISLVEEGNWDQLMRMVKVKYGDYVHMPIGTLHGEGGDGSDICIAFSTNGDVTYRLYDYGRVDPKRPLSVNDVIENVNIPDNKTLPQTIIPIQENGYLIYHYYSNPGEYVGKRILVRDSCEYELEEFMFILCVEGSGFIEDIAIKAGDTIFIPAHYGKLKIRGKLDLCILSYLSLAKEL